MGKDREERRETLRGMQHDLYDRGVPVLILIEGCGGKAMGRVVSELIDILEPRGVEYRHFVPDPLSKGPRNAVRFLESSPARGRMSIYDRGWYSQAIEHDRRFPGGRGSSVDAITSFERYLTDNGTLLVKIYLNSDGSLDDALDIPDTDCGDLSDDAVFPADYDAYGGAMADMIRITDHGNAPWNIIDVRDMGDTVDSIVDVLVKRLDAAPVPVDASLTMTYDNPRPGADLKVRSGKDCSEEMEQLRDEIAGLQCRLARSGRSVIVLFEGRDAAGKGGAIKRLAHALNPRGYHAVPIGVPTADEGSHSYLWRFCDDLPHDGHVTIFDRSWYGRMMVEPIEGLCTDEEYRRSGGEINMFENILTDSGATVVKFWMEISEEEQLERFNERRDDPAKKWKLTEDDWKNRSKWDVYERYIDRMISATNTPDAPWTVVATDDKKLARLIVLRTVRNAMKDALR